MEYQVNQLVEVKGDQDDPGFRDSWSQYKILTAPKKGFVTVQSLEFLAEGEDKLLVEQKRVAEIRPCLEDDSQSFPLQRRVCGDAVDVEKDGCWWSGTVCECFNDHITVMFPNSPIVEDPYPIFQPPQKPFFYRARTAKTYNAKLRIWMPIPRRWYTQCKDLREANALSLDMLPQQGVKSNRRVQIKRPKNAHGPAQTLVEERGKQSNSAKQMQQRGKLSPSNLAKQSGSSKPPRRKSRGLDPSGKHYEEDSSRVKHESQTIMTKGSTSNVAIKASAQMDLIEDDMFGASEAHHADLKQLGKLSTREKSSNKTFKGQVSNPMKVLGGSTQPQGPSPTCNSKAALLAKTAKPSLHTTNDPSSQDPDALTSSIAKEALPFAKSQAPLKLEAQSGTGSSIAKSLSRVDGEMGAHINTSRQPNAPLTIGKIDPSPALAEQVEETLKGNVLPSQVDNDSNNALMGQQYDTAPGCISEHIGSSKARVLPPAALFLRDTSSHLERDLGSRSSSSNLRSSSMTQVAPTQEEAQDVYKAQVVYARGCEVENEAVNIKQGLKRSASASSNNQPMQKRMKPCTRATKTSNVLCLDHLGSLFTTIELTAQLQALVDGVQEVFIAQVSIDGQACQCGWAAVCFESDEDAMVACQRLRTLCVKRPHIPFPTPILVHKPRTTKYPWGDKLYPPGCLMSVATCHFMQPNSIEFIPAQEWRSLDIIRANLKEDMLTHQRADLTTFLREHAQGLPQLESPPTSIKAHSKQLWLRGLVPKDEAIDVVTTAFCQWIGDGDMQVASNAMVQLLLDPVTKDYTGHAIVEMRSVEQAKWVVSDLNDMIFVMGFGPRPVQARVVELGHHRGAMGTLEQAVESVYGPCLGKQTSKAQLVLVESHTSKSDQTSHSLRQIMVQHMEDRSLFKEKALEWEAQLHGKHSDKFKQEFGKYRRLAEVMRSQPVLDAASKAPQRNTGAKSNMNRRDLPDLLKLMLCDNTIQIA